MIFPALVAACAELVVTQEGSQAFPRQLELTFPPKYTRDVLPVEKETQIMQICVILIIRCVRGYCSRVILYAMNAPFKVTIANFVRFDRKNILHAVPIFPAQVM